MSLVFIFGPNPKFCSFDLDLDQAEQYEEMCSLTKTNISFQEIYKLNSTFCQFVLDPSSFNLKERVHLNDPILGSLFKLSRDYCYAVNSTRKKILKARTSMDS